METKEKLMKEQEFRGLVDLGGNLLEEIKAGHATREDIEMAKAMEGSA